MKRAPYSTLLCAAAAVSLGAHAENGAWRFSVRATQAAGAPEGKLPGRLRRGLGRALRAERLRDRERLARTVIDKRPLTSRDAKALRRLARWRLEHKPDRRDDLKEEAHSDSSLNALEQLLHRNHGGPWIEREIGPAGAAPAIELSRHSALAIDIGLATHEGPNGRRLFNSREDWQIFAAKMPDAAAAVLRDVVKIGSDREKILESQAQADWILANAAEQGAAQLARNPRHPVADLAFINDIEALSGPERIAAVRELTEHRGIGGGSVTLGAPATTAELSARLADERLRFLDKRGDDGRSAREAIFQTMAQGEAGSFEGLWSSSGGINAVVTPQGALAKPREVRSEFLTALRLAARPAGKPLERVTFEDLVSKLEAALSLPEQEIDAAIERIASVAIGHVNQADNGLVDPVAVRNAIVTLTNHRYRDRQWASAGKDLARVADEVRVDRIPDANVAQDWDTAARWLKKAAHPPLTADDSRLASALRKTYGSAKPNEVRRKLMDLFDPDDASTHDAAHKELAAVLKAAGVADDRAMDEAAVVLDYLGMDPEGPVHEMFKALQPNNESAQRYLQHAFGRGGSAGQARHSLRMVMGSGATHLRDRLTARGVKLEDLDAELGTAPSPATAAQGPGAGIAPQGSSPARGWKELRRRIVATGADVPPQFRKGDALRDALRNDDISVGWPTFADLQAALATDPKHVAKQIKTALGVKKKVAAEIVDHMLADQIRAPSDDEGAPAPPMRAPTPSAPPTELMVTADDGTPLKLVQRDDGAWDLQTP